MRVGRDKQNVVIGAPFVNVKDEPTSEPTTEITSEATTEAKPQTPSLPKTGISEEMLVLFGGAAIVLLGGGATLVAIRRRS